MKKIMMTLAAVAVAATMNAQGYVGGTINFSSDKSNNGTVGTAATQETTQTGFGIAPEFGYKLDDKMAVGIALGFGFTNTKKENVGAAANVPNPSDFKTTTISIKPYLRYQVLTFGKANVFVDGGLDFTSIKATDYKAAMNFGLFVTPGISFDVNEKWSIVAKLDDMFTLGYSKNAVPDLDGAPDASSNLNFGLSTGGFQLGSLRFGVYYNF